MKPTWTSVLEEEWVNDVWMVIVRDDGGLVPDGRLLDLC